MTAYTDVATGTVTVTPDTSLSLTATVSTASVTAAPTVSPVTISNTSASTSISVTPSAGIPYIYMGDLTKYEISANGITLTKGINDAFWSVEGEIIGSITAPLWHDFSLTFTDKSGTANLLFFGPLVGCVHTFDGEKEVTRFRGFGYEYYLTKDRVRWMHIGPVDWIGDGTLPSSNSLAAYAATCYRWPAVSTTTAPSEIVVRLLQEGWPRFSSWEDKELITYSPGIAPYNILASTTYGTKGTPYTKWHGIDQDYSVTMMDLIREICDANNFIFEVRPYKNGVTNQIYPIAYFVPWASVDAEMDLPADVTITKGTTDGGLLGSFEVEENADDQYNHIHVRGYGWDDPSTGLFIAGNYYSDDYDENKERMYDVQNVYIDSSSNANDLAAYLGRSLCHSVKVYRFKLWRRFDLRLYQKIRFSGWDTTIIPSDWLRIVGISYRRSLEGDVVDCEAITDTDFINTPLKNAAMTNEVTEMAQVIRNIMSKDILPNLHGTALRDRGDGTWDIKLEDGRLIRVKDPSE